MNNFVGIVVHSLSLSDSVILVFLSLGDNQVGDEGCILIAEALRSSSSITELRCVGV